LTAVNYGAEVPKIDTADLVDSSEVAGLIGLSHGNAVSVYRKRYADSFPVPVIERGACVLWLRADVERWATARRR
jgi:predicted DNA-binding transcriptional regulator AlpA